MATVASRRVLKAFVQEAYCSQYASIARVPEEYRVGKLAELIYKALRFDPTKHPRGDDGRFIDKQHIQQAARDPKKAEALRKKVTDPEQRKKLDAAIGEQQKTGQNGAWGQAAGKEESKPAEGTTVDGRGRWVAGSDGLVHVYHGTTKANAEKIKAEGLKAPPGTGYNWFMVTSSEDSAKGYTEGKDDGSGPEVLHFAIPAEEANKVLGRAKQHDVYADGGYAAGLPTGILPAEYLVSAPADEPPAEPPAPESKKANVRPLTVDESEALARKLTGATGPDRAETIRRLTEAFSGHTKKELDELKQRLGIRASGNKAEMAKRIAERHASTDKTNRNLYTHEKVSVDEAEAKVKAAIADGSLKTPEGVRAVSKLLGQGLTGDELKELKQRLGVKAGGAKMDVARKIAERAGKEKKETGISDGKEGAVVPESMRKDDFISKHGSKLETLDVANDIVLSEPGTTHAGLVHGKEVEIGNAKPFTEITHKNGRTDRFVVRHWQGRDGKSRYTVHALNKQGVPYAQVSAGLQYEMQPDGRPKLLTVANGEPGTGLGGKLVDQLNADHGDWDISYPMSQQGAKLLHKKRTEHALAAGKPVPPEVLADYPDLAATKQPAPDVAPQGVDSGADAGGATNATSGGGQDVAGDTAPSAPLSVPELVAKIRAIDERNAGQKMSTRDRLDRDDLESAVIQSGVGSLGQVYNPAGEKAAEAKPTLPLVRTEKWDDGTEVKFLKSPFPMIPKRVEYASGSQIRSAKPSTVNLSELHATQPEITQIGLDKPSDNTGGLPLVVQSNGVKYIQDGHHRLTKEMLAGKGKAKVRFVNLDR